MNYRINKQEMLREISGWNRFLKQKVHLIACGGTALTLLGLKESTKDIDFLKDRFKETALYEIAQEKVMRNLETFLKMIKKG